MSSFQGIRLEQLVIGQGLFVKGPLNYSLEPKGIYFLEGANGSGKSTLLKTLLGRLKPLSGSIAEKPSVISYAGVENLLFSDWSLKQNFGVLATLFGVPVSDDDMPDVLRSIQLFRMEELSSGWKQISEVLLALHFGSQIVLLDEPFQALDSKHCDIVRSRIIEKSHQALILVSDHRGFGEQMPLKGKIQL